MVILCVWCTRSPLVIRTSVVAPDLGEHLGNVRQQPHRLVSCRADVDEPAMTRSGPRRSHVIGASTIDSANALTP